MHRACPRSRGQHYQDLQRSPPSRCLHPPEGGRPGTKREGKLTCAQRKRMLAELRSYESPTLADIAKKYGVTREMIRVYARKEGITYYNNAQCRARTAQRKAERKAERKAAARDRKAIRDAARAPMLDAIEALWIAGANNEEIFLKTGFRSAAANMGSLRKRFPGRFPYRRPSGSKAARAKSAPARAARAAALARKKAAYLEKLQLLETLWNAGASLEEIKRHTGYVYPGSAVRHFRRLYPGRFLPRQSA